jgi:hexosaminidase
MHRVIPQPSAYSFSPSRRPASDPLAISGPEWIKRTIELVSGHAPWPFLTVNDHGDVTVSGPATVPDETVDLPDAGYLLDIDDDRVCITCSTRSGLVAALRTLGQLQGTDGSLPIGQVTDQPAFRYRGVHLDVGRHYFDTAFVRKYVRLIAALGFNVFHWHLTDDQGWRFPVPAYPLLTEVGGYRTEADGSRYGGFYTEEEIADVVAYAHYLGVLVLPEIELPGHARAALAAYPELSCRGEPINVWNRWGVCDDVFCAGNDSVFEMLDAVFDQVVSLFPSRYVHLGGDECPKTRWNECSKCRARMEAEGCTSADELQSYFVGRAARALQARGRTAIGWDEILEGGLPEGTIVMSWRGTDGGIQAAKQGHKVIMSPTDFCYFDYKHVDADDAPGFPFPGENGRPPVLTIEKVYRFDPLNGVTPGEAHHVIGGQANLWSEQLDTPELAEQMLAPRILAMSEALWTAPAERDFKEFATRARAWLHIFEETGWTYGEAPELQGDIG